MLLGVLIPASAQTIFNCSSGFVTANTTCGVGYNGTSGYQFQFSQDPNGVITGSAANLIPVGGDGGGHTGAGLIYQTDVNVQAFTANFTYVANGKNVAFVLTNNNSAAGNSTNPQYFAGGAGCEAGFNQSFTGGNPPDNRVFALELDQFSPLTISGSFTYSSAQIYQQVETSCSPPYTSGNGTSYGTTFSPAKLSTFPVALNSPAGTPLTATGDKYSATVSYDGSNLNLCLYDVTAANGSCSSGTTGTGTYFQKTWNTINIPSLVGANTAYVGITGGTNSDAVGNLLINTFSYTVNSAPSTPSFSTWTTQAASGIGSNYSPTPTFSPAAGSYSATQSVTITSSGSSSICYSLLSSLTSTTLLPEPNSFGGCTAGTLYTGPVSVSSTETLYAMATTGTTSAAAGMPSALAYGTYTIGGSPTAATPTFSPGAGTYSSAQSVSISDATSGATIYYTTNGSTPTTSSTQYGGPITVSSTETLQAIAAASGDSNSGVASATYTIAPQATVSTPTFLPGAGTYTSAQTVNISDATSGATIYYTTDGSAPTTSSTQYTGPITVSSTETLQAIAEASGDTNSGVASAAYSIGSSSSQPVVSTPTFSPAAGAYTSAQTVSISDATSGATIYYTTNGTTPTTSSTPYTGPIAVSATETLEAMAAATGDINSAVASAVYTISSSLPSVSTPAFSPAAGTYTTAQTVTISDATSGATIYYTTNGTTPTTSSTQYTGPIAVSSTETLEAIAVATDDSAVASAAYTIASQPNFVLGTSIPSLTLSSGAQGTVTLTVTPVNGFNSPVVLACSALPSWATCSFDQATLTPSGGAVSTQLTISTVAPAAALQPDSRPFLPLASLAVTFSLFGWRKLRGRHHWLLLALTCAGLGLLSGCGAASGGAGTSSTSAVSTSTVTVTAVSGSLQGTAVIALTVN